MDDDFVTRREHEEDMQELRDALVDTERLLRSEFTHGIERVEDHLKSQDQYLKGIFATLAAWILLHYVFHI